MLEASSYEMKSSGEQTRLHRTVREEAEVTPPAELERHAFRVPTHQAVRCLQGRDRPKPLGSLQIAHGVMKVQNPGKPDFALLNQSADFVPRVFQAFVVVRPVNLIEVDDINPEALQARFAFAADACAREIVPDVVLPIPDQSALAGDDDAGAAIGDGVANDFLAVAESVYRRGIDPVDAEFEGAVNGRY